MDLTNLYRPHTLDDMYGQDAIIGPNGRLRKMIELNQLDSVIFYGPPGCGKTTAAKIIAEITNYPFINLNATTTSLTEVRKAIIDNITDDTPTVVLYLDEIQYFNKKQQQALLSYIETNMIILVAATTENPYYSCQDALLSRCSILEFKPLTRENIYQCLTDIATKENRQIDEASITLIADNSAGDMRRAIKMLSQTFIQYDDVTHIISEQNVQDMLPSTRMSGFDLDGDQHYSLISGLQKSIRGSDPNAAVFYLARLLEGGDLLSPCRRLLVIAHEDIGLAQPNAAAYVLACTQAAEQLGLPEAAKPLTNAVIYLAISPKASTCENTYFAALDDVKQGKGNVIPKYLRHACSKGYLYPHDYPNHWVRQQYLPDDLAGTIYYKPGDNTFEQNAVNYWTHIMNNQ